MRLRRRFGLLAAVGLLCLSGAAGCAASPGEVSQPTSLPEESEPTQAGPQSFSVAYSRDDTLNPFSAATEANLNLAGLLYDSLTVIDDSFTAVPSLAASVTQTDQTHLEAVLHDGAVFSDGSPVTAEDVTASFRQARAGTNYRALLANVTAADTDRNRPGVIVFTLASPDPNAAACLSFPVVKASTLTNAAAEAPVGCGLYRLQSNDAGLFLEANPYSGKQPHYQTVGLRHLPNSDTMYYGLASGGITYYFNDLNSGDMPRIAGASAAVNMNALVYLGVNTAKSGLNTTAVRQALSMLIDRRSLVSSAFSGWARPATTPFHPAWAAAAELTGLSEGRDLTGAVERLEQAGYGTAKGQQKLTLELIYSNESGSRAAPAEFLRTALEGAGVQVTVTPLSYAAYKQRLSAGKYDLYLGEIRLTANMDLSPLLTAGGSAAFGVPTGGTAADAYRRYRQGELSLAEFTAAFLEELPYIPLCWRSGYAGYDRRLSVVTPHGYNVYYGMVNWQ